MSKMTSKLSRSAISLMTAAFVWALLLASAGSAVAAEMRLAEVVWGMSPDVMTKRLPDLAAGDLVLDRKTGKLFAFDGKAVAETAPQAGQSLINRATGNLLTYREPTQTWAVTPSAGDLNVRDFGARGDYDPSVADPEASDDTGPIQAAIDAGGTFGHHAVGRTVYVPAGRYRITKPLNVTTDLKDNKHSNLIIRGDGADATRFYGNTGGAVFDFTGSVWMGLRDCSICSHFGGNQSTVGIYIARGHDHQWAIKYRVSNVHIAMHSDPKANQGIGTVGIWNFGGEHHTYNDITVEANLPVALVLSRKNPEGLPAFIESSIVKVQETNAVSQHFTTIGGTSILVANDFMRPCIYVNRCAEVRLDNTYLSMRRNPYNPDATTPGDHFYAVELYAVYQFYHHGMLEGAVVTTGGQKAPGYGYLKNPIYLDAADIKVGLAYMSSHERETPDDKKRPVHGAVRGSVNDVVRPKLADNELNRVR